MGPRGRAVTAAGSPEMEAEVGGTSPGGRRARVMPPALVRSSVYWFALAKYSGLILQFVTVVVLSRLLGPAEFGVFSVAMSLVLVTQGVREFGLANYIFQAPEVTTELLRRTQAVAYALGWCLAVAFYLARPAAAAFYDEPRLAELMGLLALGLLLVPLGQVARAVLAREMRFDIISAAELVAAVTQTGVSIGLAVAGFGPA